MIGWLLNQVGQTPKAATYTGGGEDSHDLVEKPGALIDVCISDRISLLHSDRIVLLWQDSKLA